MNLNSKGLMRGVLPESFNIVGSVGSSGEIRQIELNLIPSLIESHWHRADKRFNSRCALVVRSPESSSNVLVI